MQYLQQSHWSLITVTYHSPYIREQALHISTHSVLVQD